MSRKGFGIILILTVAASVAVFYYTRLRSTGVVLTGIVTTDEVTVGSQIAGRLDKVLVKEGDTVSEGQLLAVIAPKELRADQAYYDSAMKSSGAQVAVAESTLKYQELQLRDQVRQAEANLAAAQAQQKQAAANLEQARLTFNRTHGLFQQGIASAQSEDQARTALEAAQANVESLHKQVQAQEAALALARSNAEQVAIREQQLSANRHQYSAAQAQDQAAGVRLGYTEIRAPIKGFVAVRAALEGEVVSPGQPVVVLYDPDNLWVRVDVEESFIDKIRLGEPFPVRFPSGREETGTVYFRGVDADYATQRDVSRTKRDIKTFEVRLRVDNSKRELAPGLTAFVTVPSAVQ
ncbi:MAG: HlyD family secretion protein [Deltaproteobacteria bacterium]